MTRANDICPTEAQIWALLDHVRWPSLYAYAEWAGLLRFEAVIYAVSRGCFTWRELFDQPEWTLAQAFDDWQDDFRDLDLENT
jgi:hypothetical protein